MSNSDTTAVNRGDQGSKNARMLVPDPMKPHAMFNPEDIPKRTQDADQDDEPASGR